MATKESFSRGRSPRYPRISLNSSIAYVRKLYEEAHRATVDADTAARLMGFSGKSGASAIVLGAVRQFGLVDGLRGSIKISDLAMRIVQSSSAEEEEEARHVAAFSPDVYDEVVKHFEGELPRSDEPVKAFLIRSRGFSRSGAEDCIATLRKTLAELVEFRSDHQVTDAKTAGDLQSDVDSVEPRTSTAEPQFAGRKESPTPDYELVRIPLSRDCTAEVRLTGTVTSGAIDRLVQYIELMRGVWAEEE